MTIIMPEGNLDEFESTLRTEKLNHYYQEVSPSEREVILKMPKFGFGVTHDLNKEGLQYDFWAINYGS